MYLAVLTVILGWAIFFRAPLLAAYAGIVGAGFHLYVVIFEEPRLHRRFDESYAAYCARVPRWLPRKRQ